MPYRRRVRRQYRRRRGPMSRGRIYGSAAGQLWRDVKYLKSIINVERKYLDVNDSTATASQTPTLVLLNAMALGDTAITRDGQSIKMVSSYLKIWFRINSAATTSLARIIMFLDTQTNAAAPVAADLLQSTTNPQSPLLIANGTRFKIITDKLYTLSINGTENIQRKFFKKLGVHTKYNTGNAGTIADITTGSLHILFMSNESTNTVSVQYWHRLRFIDN